MLPEKAPKIRWQDKIPDIEVLKRAGMPSVHTLLKLAQLRWTGHVTRMSDERPPKKVFYGELPVGKRSQGGQKKRYKYTLKASRKDFNTPPESWEQIALDRAKLHCLIWKGADDYEAKRICEAERKHKARAKGWSSESSFSELPCSICNKQFTAKLGIISHQRTHQHTWTPHNQRLSWSFSRLISVVWPQKVSMYFIIL